MALEGEEEENVACRWEQEDKVFPKSCCVAGKQSISSIVSCVHVQELMQGIVKSRAIYSGVNFPPPHLNRAWERPSAVQCLIVLIAHDFCPAGTCICIADMWTLECLDYLIVFPHAKLASGLQFGSWALYKSAQL